MANRKPTGAGGSGAIPHQEPRSRSISDGGIENGADMMALHSALIADVLNGRIDRRQAQTVIGHSRIMLAIVDMAYRHGGMKGGKGTAPKAITFLP